jgi:glycosyl transferase, family 25
MEFDTVIEFCFIVPSFNNESNIEKNMTSLITQTSENWRCIYINDCSTDNTELLFFNIIRKYNAESKFTYIKNDMNYGQAYSKYTAYRLLSDFEIVCLLDGDDWLADVNVVTRLTKRYSDRRIQMLSTDYHIWDDNQIYKNFNFSKYSDDIIANKKFRDQPDWLIRHLKTGYGIYFKSIPKEYLQINGKWLRVCTDVAEMYSALELCKGTYSAVSDVMYIYNKSNSIKYTTSYYRQESKAIHKQSLEHVLSLPHCKYTLPKTYIINMAKCTKKREYMMKQLLFQSNTNFKFIDAVEGLVNPETDVLIKKYFQYMNLENSSQGVSYSASIMLTHLKEKYNYRRQHITRGSLGLIQSIFLLLNDFVQGDESHVLIFEDDVYTIKDFDKVLFMNNELLKDKDLVYLGCHTSDHNIYPEKSDSVFIELTDNKELIYGGYSIIVSRRLAEYILDIGIDKILRLNLSWDLLLNYILETEDRFTFFLYFKQLFIPNVIKHRGINQVRDVKFYNENKISLHDYYIPDVIDGSSENDIALVMSRHSESCFEFVSKVVYINLESRPDRKKHVEEQLLKYISPSNIIRFNAIKHEKGAIGCGLSHIAVLEMAIAENWDNVFIVEDDLTWTNNFESGHDILENLVRNDYDAIVLGASFIKSYRNSFKLISCNCALAYIVNKQYYGKLLECFKYGVDGLIRTYSKGQFAIDVVWKKLQKSDNWFIVKPNMCIQIPSYSSIENNFKDYTDYFDFSLEYTQEPHTNSTYNDDMYNDNGKTDWYNPIRNSNLPVKKEDRSIKQANIKIREASTINYLKKEDTPIKSVKKEDISIKSIKTQDISIEVPSNDINKYIKNRPAQKEEVNLKRLDINNIKIEVNEEVTNNTSKKEDIHVKHLDLDKKIFGISDSVVNNISKKEDIHVKHLDIHKLNIKLKESSIKSINFENKEYVNPLLKPQDMSIRPITNIKIKDVVTNKQDISVKPVNNVITLKVKDPIAKNISPPQRIVSFNDMLNMLKTN